MTRQPLMRVFCCALLMVVFGCKEQEKQVKIKPKTAASVAAPNVANQKTIPEVSLPPRGDLLMRPFREWGLEETTVDALARIGKPAVPALAEALHDSNPRLRDSAAKGLARIGPDARSAVRDLVAQLNDEDISVRKNVIRALGQIGPEAREAVPDLMKTLRGERPKPKLSPDE